MVDYSLNFLPLSAKEKIFRRPAKLIPYEESQTKVNMQVAQVFAQVECYRELLVSWYQFLPLIKDQVSIQKADYILYMHPYARCENLSEFCYNSVKDIVKLRKPGAKIVICGKTANLQSRLETDGIKDLIFFKSNYTREVGKLLNVAIRDEHFVYDDLQDQLNIWPVDGCMQHCGFCRRCYMDIPFESQTIEYLKKNLDWYRSNFPQKMRHISLRAENLTEYGLDLYGYQRLPDVIKLIDSYAEIEEISLDIGMNIGEITEEILDSLTQSKKINLIYMNLEAGTNRLLKFINKAHTVEKAKYVAKRLRTANPAIKIESTVMIGLPTETLADIHALADLISEITIDNLQVNYYIPAEGHTLPKELIPQGRLKQYHLGELLKCLRSLPIALKAVENSNELHPSMQIQCYADDSYKKTSKKSYQRRQSRIDLKNTDTPGYFPKHRSKKITINYLTTKRRISSIDESEPERSS